MLVCLPFATVCRVLLYEGLRTLLGVQDDVGLSRVLRIASELSQSRRLQQMAGQMRGHEPSIGGVATR